MATTINTIDVDDIDSVLAKALAKQPDARYQTGEEMAAAVRECLEFGA